LRVTTGGLDYADFVGYDDDRWLSKRKLMWEQMTEILSFTEVGEIFKEVEETGFLEKNLTLFPNGQNSAKSKLY